MATGSDIARKRRVAFALGIPIVLAIAAPTCEPQPPSPGGTFVDDVVFSGLNAPTTVRFAADGRVFVAEKSGRLLVFDNLDDPTPSLFADLRTEVYDHHDRGLLGLALSPQFPSDPWVYVAYTRDAEIGGVAPRWGSPGVTGDPCPTPPGGGADGCVVSGRVSRLRASGNVMVEEQVLIDDWCMQGPSHTVGAVAFGPDGALYVSGGDGAFFGTQLDYGQKGIPRNPCGDPPVPVGGTQTIPSAQGGALRSQDRRTPSDPTTLDGAIIRVDPTTGAGLADNPFASSSDPNARRLIAYGLRNPFRMAFRPGTSQLWVGDVGWQTWEEINRVAVPADATVENFGWPCYEGNAKQPGWDAANLTLCENLYGTGADTRPRYSYRHNQRVDPNDTCDFGGSVSGLAFMPANSVSYPAEYRRALFFADYSRGCIWVVPAAANGSPDFAQLRVFASAASPVDLQIGPGNDLFYVDIVGGTIRRIAYNPPPRAVATADPQSGPLPLDVQFDGTGSSDPDGDPLTYAWDLDGDGAFDDSTSPTPTYTYTTSQDYTVRLRVTDSHGDTGQTSLVISAGTAPPTAVIDTPTAGTTWAVGETIAFSGHATDPDEGTLPDSALTWTLVLHHCPSTCHQHTIETFSGTASGSFVGPDHEYPSHLELRLTATDARGLQDTASVLLQPRTKALTLESAPSGLTLAAGPVVQATPFTTTVIEGATVSVSAPSPQTLDGTEYQFLLWSDGQDQTHAVVVSEDTTLTAAYAPGP
jgi:glucose/arabinose dehydrogenase